MQWYSIADRWNIIYFQRQLLSILLFSGFFCPTQFFGGTTLCRHHRRVMPQCARRFCSLNRSIMQFPFLNFYHLSMSAMHASCNEYLSEVNVLIALASCIKQRKINTPIHLIFFNWYILDGTFRPSIRWNNFENRPIIMVSGLLPWLRQLARSWVCMTFF